MVSEQTQTIALTIDDRVVEARRGQTVLEVCRNNDIHVPTLCHDPRLEPYGACRLCLVQVEGMRGFPTSCTTMASDGMIVTTRSEEIQELRRSVVELLLSDHELRCLSCDSAGACALQDIAYEFGIEESPYHGERHRVWEGIDENQLIERDYTKCISCGRCVRICDEVQGCNVYGFTDRGFESIPNTPYATSLQAAGCEFCGQCVSTCPVGALTDKRSRYQARQWEAARVETTCGYCGVGCTVEYRVKDGRIVGATAPLDRGVNKGNLCAKGRYGYSFTHHADRLTTPLVRKNGELVETSWEEALALVANRLSATVNKHGADAVAGLASAKCTNEEDYLFQKLMRTGLGTHNIDHCARLCHSSTVTGLAAAFGSGAMTNSYDDLTCAEVILVVGSNTTEAHPIIALQLKKASRNGTKIVVVDPRRIKLVDHAEDWLRIRPGSNVALVNAMMRVILDEGLVNETFVAERTEGFEELAAHLKNLDVAAAAATCGLSEEQIRSTAIAYASAERAAIIYCMGVTQHTSGTDQVRSFANLAMLAGQIGRPGTGVNPLRGQNNVQGACDLACLPSCLPGYQSLSDTDTLDRFCDAWETKVALPSKPGLTVVEMMDAAAAGDLKAMYIMGENPMLSDPDQAHVREALDALDFLVVQDIFETETTRYADVVLPAASFLEKEGTFTNSERRIQRVRKVVDAPGDSRTDLDILIALSALLELDWDYEGPAEVMIEMSAVTPQYDGISYRRLDSEGGIQWPCPTDDHPGTPILHVDGFARGKGAFAAIDYVPPAEEPDDSMPFVLMTGRHLWNFHTSTMTGHSEGLNELNPTGYAEISTEDAKRLEVCDGDILEIESKRGMVAAPARVTDRVRPGELFMPFHFVDVPANALTNGKTLDPQAKIPGLKTTPVGVRKA